MGARHVDEARPRIVPAGEYFALPRGCRTYMFGGRRPKLCVELELICATDGSDAHAGAILARTYNVRRLSGKSGFQAASWSSDLLREYVRCTGHTPERLDRIPMTRLRGELRVRVRTVMRDRRGDELPESLRYSVVESLVAAARHFPPSPDGKR